MRVLFTLLLCLVAGSVAALPRVEDVQDAVRRSDYPAAENLVREVLGEKPENAKAHYLLAEILAHEGRIVEAKRQAEMARQYDPQISFTSPERFRQFEARLGTASDARKAAPDRRAPAAAAADSPFGGGSLWLLLLVGAGVVWFVLRRRNAAPRYGSYGNANDATFNTQGYPPGAPGYPPGQGYPPGAYPPNYPRGGVGSSVAAGLGGIATGMLAEHLIEGAMGRHHEAGNLPDATHADQPSADSFHDQPIDFGNGGDWDAGSGSDDGGGFDAGGGSDWN